MPEIGTQHRLDKKEEPRQSIILSSPAKLFKHG